MSGLVEFNAYQAEALLICLGASLLWAALLLVGARSLERAAPMTSSERLWTLALLFAVLPSLVAPTLAAFGVSLRPAPEIAAFDMAPVVVVADAAAQEFVPLSKPAFLTSEQIVSGAALLYVYGVVLAFFLWVGRQACLQYAVSRAALVEDWNLFDRIEEWADRLEVQMPTIRRSRHVSSVCITGVVRQTILIPDGIETRVGSDDVVLMCAHELAHVRRGDTRLFTATQLARVLFWFNPLVGRIARNAELAAEESADALVLEKGVDRRVYAACFVEGLKFAAFKMNVQPALAPSFTPADPGGRRRRLNAILSPEAPRKTPLSTRLLLSAAASTVALVAVGQAALAVDPESAAADRNLLSDLPLIGDVTMGFGEKHEATGGEQGPAHNGLDIKAPKGAKIFAPGDGVVIEATDRYKGSTAWGKVVVIDHGHGLVTRYAHLDSYSVKKGERVKAGDVIAKVGATGKTTGPHLHFETMRDGKAVDPAKEIASASMIIDAVPATPATPAIEAAPAIPAEPAEDAAPVIAPEKPAHPLRYSYKLAPADDIPEAPGVKKFSPSNEFASFRMSGPGFAEMTIAAPKTLQFAQAGSFGFAGGSTFAALAEDLEERLLGAANGEVEGSYNLTLRDGEKVYRFSSEEPMTAEKRAELREALKTMRKNEENSRKEAAKLRDKEAAKWRREMERVKAEARMRARDDAKTHFPLDDEQIAAIRREAELAGRRAGQNRIAAEQRILEDEERKRDAEMRRLEARDQKRAHLEMQLEALEDARADMDDEIADRFDDALADLDDAEADLDDSDMSREERKAMRNAIREQRNQLMRDGEVHKRAIKSAQEQIGRQIESVAQMLEELENEESED